MKFRNQFVASLAAVALAVSANPAMAAVDKTGTLICAPERAEYGPYAQGLAYGTLKVRAPGQSYYVVWYFPTWDTGSANGKGKGGYWRAVVETGALNDWGTFVACRQS